MVKDSIDSLKLQHLVQYDGTVGNDEDGRNIFETIADDSISLPDEELDKKKISNVISASLSRLTKREEQVMRLRFGLCDVVEDENFALSKNDLDKIRSK
jgi:DNA-directed RNA polymerase sigma subunit (sigma70/sigma32)